MSDRTGSRIPDAPIPDVDMSAGGPNVGTPSEPPNGTVAASFSPLDVAHDAVISLGAPVQPSDVDTYLRLQENSERMNRLKEVLDAWKSQHVEERRLRASMATVLIWILGVELALIFVAFFMLGFKVIVLDQWAADVFLVGALTQTVGLVTIVAKYLFPKRSVDILGQLDTWNRGWVEDAHEKKSGSED